MTQPLKSIYGESWRLAKSARLFGLAFVIGWIIMGLVLASNGAMIGTYSVGGENVAFDGTNIWVTNYALGEVNKLLASTGALAGTYSVGSGPEGVAFDGTNIWVANYFGNNVTKLLAASNVSQFQSCR